MIILGITGSFGTGKTTVAKIFRSLGAKVLDADRIAHKMIEKRAPAYRKIVKIFGASILDKKGNIQRGKLAEIVFNDNNKLERLNRIVHPEVIKFIKKKICSANKRDVIVIDAPLLIEANVHKLADYLIVVRSSRPAQISRCSGKFCIEKRSVMKRIVRQMPLKKKIEMADFVIDNDGAMSQTKKQVKKIWKEIVWR